MEKQSESIDLFQLGLMLSKREGVKDLGNNTFAAKTQDEIAQEIIEENAKIKKQDILDLRKVLDNLDAPNEEIEKTIRVCVELKNKLKSEKHFNSNIDIRIAKELDSYVDLLEHVIIQCSDRLKHRAERETIDLEYIIDERKLIDAYQYFVENWTLEIGKADFKKLFCLDIQPTVFPEFKKRSGGVQSFSYFLSLIKDGGFLNLTDDEIDKHFGISYRSTMQRVNKKAEMPESYKAIKLTTRNKIDDILNPKTKVRAN